MTEEKHKSRAWVSWAVVVLALGVFYPLSFGPAAMISKRAGASGLWMTIPYAPIKWANEHSEIVHRVIVAYLKFWI